MLSAGLVIVFLGYAVLYSGVRKLQGWEISVWDSITGGEGQPREVSTTTSGGSTGTNSSAYVQTLRSNTPRRPRPRRTAPSRPQRIGSSGSSGSSSAGCKPPGKLSRYKGATMIPEGIAALKRAEKRAGVRIIVVSSYRTCAEQERACNGICGGGCAGCPGLCAPCGQSCHQRGLAIDVANWAKVQRALIAQGFHHPLPDSDPGHFSYGACNG
jgi:hypothetical protein